VLFYFKLLFLNNIKFYWRRLKTIWMQLEALVRTAEVASITPVLTDKHRLSGRQSGHRKTRFIRMMSWEIQGLGTKEWAARAAPFFARVLCAHRLQIILLALLQAIRGLQKSKNPRKAGFCVASAAKY